MKTNASRSTALNIPPPQILERIRGSRKDFLEEYKYAVVIDLHYVGTDILHKHVFGHTVKQYCINQLLAQLRGA